MALFELSHFSGEKPLYEEGFILLPHLATLALCILPGGEITDIYLYFVCGALHLICSGIVGVGGIYHAKSKQQSFYFDIGNPPGKSFSKNFFIIFIVFLYTYLPCLIVLKINN